MNGKRVLWTLYSFLYYCIANAANKTDLVKSLANHPSKNIMLITNSPKTLSSTSMLVIREISNTSPFTFVNIKDFASACDNKNVETPKELSSMRFQGEVLTIIFIDGNMERNLTQGLIHHMIFLNDHIDNTPRPKCLVILENAMYNSDILEFLKFSWEYKFLYVTVVEFFQSSKENQSPFLPMNELIAIVHQYNPFTAAYEEKHFFKEDELFFDKLRDLNGFSLNAGLEEDS